MECNILRSKDLKQGKCYSITHYQTGIAISIKRYTSINKALLDLEVEEIVKKLVNKGEHSIT